jgi:hypothetical protein
MSHVHTGAIVIVPDACGDVLCVGSGACALANGALGTCNERRCYPLRTVTNAAVARDTVASTTLSTTTSAMSEASTTPCVCPAGQVCSGRV